MTAWLIAWLLVNLAAVVIVSGFGTALKRQPLSPAHTHLLPVPESAAVVIRRARPRNRAA